MGMWISDETEKNGKIIPEKFGTGQWVNGLCIENDKLISLHQKFKEKEKERNSRRQFPKVENSKIKKINQILSWLKMKINELNDKY